ncbi:hypothetical protein [Terrimonas pollutisoli]|uniref:hypothetical protein n=1 Tax=Terrimonas pollutisoli TaxID=3034147 RepID=UPI0023EDF0C2|nr:hypothetical protein [Terrimonas sp. H1YJ31]
MGTAGVQDKQHIVNILASSFDDNKGVNYIIPQDKRRKQRIRKLMEYSFDICHLYGKVFLADDQHGCALVLFPDKKRTSIKRMWLDLKLVFFSIGLFHLKKAIEREVKIKERRLKKLCIIYGLSGLTQHSRAREQEVN